MAVGSSLWRKRKAWPHFTTFLLVVVRWVVGSRVSLARSIYRICEIRWLTHATFRIISLTMIIPVWGFSSAGRAPALQAGGRGFESLKLHQTGSKLEKPSQKCGGFSVSYSEVTVIARFNSLIRSSVVPTGNTYRRYPHAPLFI